MWPGAVDRSSRPALNRLTAPALQSASNRAANGSSQTVNGLTNQRIQDGRSTEGYLNRAAVKAGLRQGNSRRIYVADHRSTPDVRQGQPQTNKRKCGIQPAHQSLFTDVFVSRPLLCTIHPVPQLLASTRGDELSRALCLTWDIRDSFLARL